MLDFFETPELRHCVAKLFEAIQREGGIHYLKGPTGAGKSRVAERLTRLLDSKYRVLVILLTQ